MSLLIGNDLAKSYGALDVFEHIDLRIEQADRIGLIGPNGQGKTTLLKILAGVELPTAGRVERARRLRIGYLPQLPPPPGDQTLIESLLSVFADLQAQERELAEMERAMAEARDEAELEALLERYGAAQARFEASGGFDYELRIQQVLSGLGFDETDYHQPLAILSGGQRTRALLARLILEEPDLLLLDEPTNHLDIDGMEWLEETLRQWKGAVVVVAHDRYFLDRVATRIWDLHDGRLDTYRGNYSHYLVQREQRRLEEERLWEQQQEFIAKTEEFIRRNIAGQRSKEAQGRLKRLERFKETMAIERLREQRQIRLHMSTQLRSGDLVLATHALQVGYPPGPPLFTCPDVEIRRGQRVALMGPNGVGKTTFVRTILGEIPPLGGKVRLGASLRIGYLSQTQAGLDPHQTVLDAILEVAPKLTEEAARRILGRFLFTGDDVFKPIEVLSGGQRSRVVLARLSLQGSNFLVLDEPTNHLDLETQEILQDELARFPGTILLVTHDRYLAQKLATHVWELRDGQLRAYEGGYDAYLEAKAAERAAQQGSQGQEATTDAQIARERMREERRQRQARKRLMEQAAALEAQIHEVERALASLSEEIAEASERHDLARVEELGATYADLEGQLHELMEAWAKIA
ncbi:MAG: ABC-F family ATP-binding cassette domain-containing protein [Anaerolineae bacterium]